MGCYCSMGTRSDRSEKHFHPNIFVPEIQHSQMQSCQVVQIFRILYDNAIRILMYDFAWFNTDFKKNSAIDNHNNESTEVQRAGGNNRD